MALKAKTKGQRKRGRPPKQGVARTDSGRISRAKEPINKLALEARMRMHKISKEDAGSQEAGSPMGRMHMAYMKWRKEIKGGKNIDRPQPELSLSTAQYYGLLQYQELHNDYLKAIGAPGAHYDPYLGNSGDERAHEEWTRSVKERHAAARAAIQEAQNYERSHNLWAALDLCVLREQDLPHMVGTLRTLGNVLAKHFRWG